MFYENYLNSIKPNMSIIPESASISDMAIFTERAIQDVFNETFINVAMQEMTMFSSLNEADEEKKEAPASPEAKKKKLETIKGIISKIWGAIKGFFMNAIDKVKEIYTKFKVEKGKVIEKDFKESIAALSKTDTSNFKVKMIGAGVAKDVAESKSDFDAIAKYAADMNQELLGSGAFADSSTDFAEKYSAANIKENLGKLKTFEREVVAKEYGFDQVKKNPYITKFVFAESTMLSQLKEEYNKAKTLMDVFMKMGKDMVNKKPNANLSAYIKGVSQISKCLTDVAKEYIKYGKKVRSNYVAVISHVIVSAKRAVKEDTEISIDVQETPGEDTNVEVKAPEAPATDVEVKDEVEEAFGAFNEEDEPAEGEADAVAKTADETPAEIDASVDIKEDNDVEINIKVEDEGEEESEEAPVEESALYQALVAYLD